MNSWLVGIALAIAVVMVVSRTLSRRIGIPYPVFLVVAGAAASFLPNVPPIHLNPEVVFLGFLPPLVYHAGIVTSPRELRANAMPIGLGALGLVLATTFSVAGTVWGAVPALAWTPALLLGAVVAPTDPVSATSVLRRLGGPPHVTTILEGESLVNDGIALSLFSLIVAGGAGGIGGGFVAFLKVAGGGALFGFAVGWAASRVRRPFRDPASQVVLSLLIPFVAYLPANALGLSGVLATLVAGLVLGQRPVTGLDPSGRVRNADFWQVLVFLLESALFVLVGLELREIVGGISQYAPSEIALVSGLAVFVVIIVRLLWWLVIPTVRRRPSGRFVDTGEVPWRERILLGWCGMRGAISLAAALSIPVNLNGSPFPDRNLIIFATFCVIAVTMLGQATTLPLLVRRLSLAGSEILRHQHVIALRRCAEVALRTLDELLAQGFASDPVAETLRAVYERRLDEARAELEEPDASDTDPTLREVHRRLLQAQHRALSELHVQHKVSFSVMLAVRRELDLEIASLGP